MAGLGGDFWRAVAIVAAFFVPYAWWAGAIALGASAVASHADRRAARRMQREALERGARDRLQMIAGTDVPRSIAYGRTRTSGVIAFAHSYGNANERLALAVALFSGHAIDGIERYWFGDREVGPLDANGYPTSAPFLVSRADEHMSDEFATSGSTSQQVTLSYAPQPSSVEGTVYGDVTDAWQVLAIIRPLSVSGNVATFDTSAFPVGSKLVVSYFRPVTEPVLRIKPYLGLPGQQADADLIAVSNGKWTSNHVGTGVSYLAVFLKYNDNVFPSGLESITAEVRGRRVYDPRLDSTNGGSGPQRVDQPGTWTWSRNPALIVADYLRDKDLGAGLSAVDIDWPSVIAAANVCDEPVSEPELVNGQWQTVQRPRYVCDVLISSASSKKENLDTLLEAMAGTCVYSGGKAKLIAGAYSNPVLALSEQDMVGNALSVAARTERAMLYNSVRGSCFDAQKKYHLIPFPPYKSATYVAQDGGSELWMELSYETQTDIVRAQRLARLELRRHRESLTVTASFSLRALLVQPGDVITLTVPRYGWSAKPFRVMQRAFSADGAVTLTLREDSPAIYSWSASDPDLPDIAPNTSLPDPRSVAPPSGVSIASGDATAMIDQTGRIVPRLLIEWPASNDAAVTQGGQVEIELADSSTEYSVWQQLVSLPGYSEQAYAECVVGAAYVARVRFVNGLGVKSTWAYSVIHVAAGSGAPAPAVSGLQASILRAGILLSWTPAASADVADYEIRSGPSWESAAVLARVKTGSWLFDQSQVGTIRFFVAARSVRGTYSKTPASVDVSVVPPSAVSDFTVSIVRGGVLLSWQPAQTLGTFQVEWTELRMGSSWNSATFVARTKSTNHLHASLPTTARTYWAAQVDEVGNYSAPVSILVQYDVPGAVQNLTAQALINQVILRWAPPSVGSLPIDSYEIRRGSTTDSWSSAAHLAYVSGTAIVFSESITGSVRYFVAAIDAAGTTGQDASITVVVTGLDNFTPILAADLPIASGGTTSSVARVSGALYAPSPIGEETFSQHFSTRSWNTPQDQIDAGYPAYWMPSTNSGQYEYVHDAGTTIPTGSVLLTETGTTVAGSVTITPEVAVSNTSASGPWSSISNGGVATSFRWVRCRLTYAASGGDDLRITTSARLVISVTRATDSGTAAANAGDSGGTSVAFNRTFSKVIAIEVTPTATAARYGVVNFDYSTDNPTSFSVLLFDSSGARVSGNFSWIAHGIV